MEVVRGIVGPGVVWAPLLTATAGSFLACFVFGALVFAVAGGARKWPVAALAAAALAGMATSTGPLSPVTGPLVGVIAAGSAAAGTLLAGRRRSPPVRPFLLGLVIPLALALAWAPRWIVALQPTRTARVRAAIAYDVGAIEALGELGFRAHRAGDLVAAEAIYTLNANLEPASIRWPTSRIGVLVDQHRCDEAETALSRLTGGESAILLAREAVTACLPR